jgi:hypothetical protein
MSPHSRVGKPRCPTGSGVALLDLVRDHIGLTGSNKVSEHGQCGASTVQSVVLRYCRDLSAWMRQPQNLGRNQGRDATLACHTHFSSGTYMHHFRSPRSAVPAREVVAKRVGA